MNFIGGLLGGGLGLVYMLAGPVTYIILVVDTWQGKGSAALKIFLNLTLDGLLAAIWPATWLIWAIQAFAGNETAVSRVFG